MDAVIPPVGDMFYYVIMFFQVHEERDTRQSECLPSAECLLLSPLRSRAYLALMVLNPFGIGLSRMIL